MSCRNSTIKEEQKALRTLCDYDGLAARRRTSLGLMGGIILIVALLINTVSAADPISFHPPATAVLCQPINLSWTGGLPPYRLDVEPLAGSTAITSQNERHVDINNTLFTWTPDFPAGTTLQLEVTWSGLVGASAGGHTIVQPSSNHSCLLNATTTLQPTIQATSFSSNISTRISTSTSVLAIASVPNATSSTPVRHSSAGGLSKGSIAGIVVAICLVFIGLIVYSILKRRSLKRLGDTHDGNSVSPYKGISPTLISIDQDKQYNYVLPSQSGFGTASSHDGPNLRPTPYLVPRDSTTSLSATKKAHKHIRELSNSSANLSSSDARAMSASPTQLGSDDATSSVLRSDSVGGDVLVFSADGNVRFSGGLERVGSFGETVEIRSESGEATLPPAYAHYATE